MSKYLNKSIIYDNIKFKSILEKRAYQLYKEAGFNPEYEPVSFIIAEKLTLDKNVKFYKPFKKVLSCNRKILRPITYTPDFIFKVGPNVIIVDTKGLPNETYPLKIKLFLTKCHQIYKNESVYFFEPHSISQIKQSIQIIQKLLN